MLAVYGGATKDLLKEIGVLQERAVKVSMGLPRLTPSEEVYELFKIAPIGTQRNVKVTLLLCPLLIMLPREHHAQNTRRQANHLLSAPRSRLASSARFALPTFISLYNSMPLELRRILDNQHVVDDNYLKRPVKKYFREDANVKQYRLLYLR